MELPKAFVDEIDSYGCAALAGLADALATTAPQVSVRVNRAKGAEVPQGAPTVEWCGDGFYLDTRPQFTFDPAFHQGRYYVQDASSMSVTAVMDAIIKREGGKPLVVLDACAAPGGKTTAIASVLPKGSLLFANEFDFRRASILAENMAKWGAENVVVTRGDTGRYSAMEACFDVIAADVPCSGEGMMRKDSEAVSQWSPKLVDDCVSRQREIVDKLWPALRPGGYMVYSTCTFNRRENEEMVEYICTELGGESVDVGLASMAGVSGAICGTETCARFIPGRVRGEGLFVCLIRKNNTHASERLRVPKKQSPQLTAAPSDKAFALKYLLGEFTHAMLDDRLMALPQAHAKFITKASPLLDILSAGVELGAIKGRDFIPSQSLALSVALNPKAFPTFEVDYAKAIAYLRREAFEIDAATGFVLLTYGGKPLGFVKNLGRRCNNLYPQQWRITSSSVPTEGPKVL